VTSAIQEANPDAEIVFKPEFDVRTKVTGCNCFRHERRAVI
jgi:hypothetical protein